ncbi:MAG: cytochrome b, partial [Planifilum fulgidum]
MSRRKPLWRMFFALMAMVLLMTGCGDKTMNIFEPKGTAGEQQLDLVMLSVYIMIFVFAVVISIYVYVLVRYRQRPGDDAPPKQVEGNTMIEVLWTAIPVILLIILAIPTVSTTFSLAKEPPEEDS